MKFRYNLFGVIIFVIIVMIVISSFSVVWRGVCVHTNYGVRVTQTQKRDIIIPIVNVSNFDDHNETVPILFPQMNLTQLSQPRVIFSLTSSPKRIQFLNETLYSLLNQEIMPKKIQINLPFVFRRTGEQFTNVEKLDFLKHPLIEINRCDDIGPITKLVPTLHSETNADTLIIVVDDDTVYPPDLIHKYIQFSSLHPNQVIVGHCGDTLLDGKYSVDDGTCSLFESFGASGFKRSFFSDNFTSYVSQAVSNNWCLRSDDYVISNYLVNKGIRGWKAEGHIRSVVQLQIGLNADALHNLEKSKVGFAHHLVYQNCGDFLATLNITAFKVLPPRLKTWNTFIRKNKEGAMHLWNKFLAQLC